MLIRHFTARIVAVAAVAAMAAASVSTVAQSRQTPSPAALMTRAERSNFTETSRYDDVQRFLAAAAQASDLVHLTSFGYTFEGRSLPLAVVGRVPNATPDAVRASGKLRVYIQANIHAVQSACAPFAMSRTSASAASLPSTSPAWMLAWM